MGKAVLAVTCAGVLGSIGADKNPSGSECGSRGRGSEPSVRLWLRVERSAQVPPDSCRPALRLQKILPEEFNKPRREFCDFFSNIRNQELHTCDLPFEALSE